MKNSTQHSVISLEVAHRLWQWGLVVLVTMALSGCGLGSSVGNAMNSAANGAVEIPAEIKESKIMLEVSVLASMARPNPFNNLLIKEADPTEEMAETPGTEPEAAPPQSPFEGFSLGGIIYREKRPLAILGLPGGKSKIVHVGDVLQTAVEPIKISKITKNSVCMAVSNNTSTLPVEMQNKTLNVVSLIGYQGKKSASGGGAAPAAATAAPAAAPAAAKAPAAETPAEADNNFVPNDIKNLLQNGNSKGTTGNKPTVSSAN